MQCKCQVRERLLSLPLGDGAQTTVEYGNEFSMDVQNALSCAHMSVASGGQSLVADG